MAHAHAALPRFPLDAKRIAATSAVIALHAGVLMLLLMPAQVARTPLVEDEPPPYIPVKIEVPPPIPLPPTPRPPSAHAPVHTPVAIPDPPVEAVDQSVSAVDVPMPDPAPTPDTFDPGPASVFVQLATRVAPPPPYPGAALRRKLTGTVKLRIHVDAAGLPLEVSVEESSGHELLDQAAVKTVRTRWRFVPALRDGVPIEAWALVPIEFVLQ
jgi:protein TonB